MSKLWSRLFSRHLIYITLNDFSFIDFTQISKDCVFVNLIFVYDSWTKSLRSKLVRFLFLYTGYAHYAVATAKAKIICLWSRWHLLTLQKNIRNKRSFLWFSMWRCCYFYLRSFYVAFIPEGLSVWIWYINIFFFSHINISIFSMFYQAVKLCETGAGCWFIIIIETLQLCTCMSASNLYKQRVT